MSIETENRISDMSMTRYYEGRLSAYDVVLDLLESNASISELKEAILDRYNNCKHRASNPNFKILQELPANWDGRTNEATSLV